MQDVERVVERLSGQTEDIFDTMARRPLSLPGVGRARLADRRPHDC